MASKPFLAILCIVALLFVAAMAQEAPKKLDLNKWSETYAVSGKQFGQMLYIEIPTDEITREVIVRMKPVSSASGFDPDIFVRWGQVPTRQDFDSSDVSTAVEHVVTLTKSTEHPMAAGEKLYIGVYAYSTVGGSFQVYVETHGCIYGKCGGEERGVCDALTGECSCKPGFQTLPYCRASDQNLALDTKVNEVLHQHQISYYYITLPSRQKKAWLHVDLVRSAAGAVGSAVLAIKKGGLPTAVDNTAVEWIFSYHSSASLILDDNEYSEGKWTVAVINNSKGDFAYSLTSTVHYCKNNCSHHGTCAPATSTCTCDEHYQLRPDDCSIRSDKLEVSKPQYLSFEPWSYTYFTIPVTQAYADAPLEFGVQLFLQNKTAISAASYPTMYATMGKDNKPSPMNFDFASPQPATLNQTLYFPDSKIAAGVINLVIVNQNARDFLYMLNLSTRPHCPHGCLKNGHCTDLAECRCSEGFTGGSCDLSQKDCDKIRGISSGSMSYGAALGVFLIALALAAGISAFVFAKFFYVSPQQPAPEMQYDPLSV